MAVEREGGYERGPGDGIGFVSLGHLVEHLSGVLGAPAFAVRVNESCDGEEIEGEASSQDEVGVCLLCGAEASESCACFEERREGKVVGKESCEEELLVDGEGILGVLMGFLGDAGIPMEDSFFHQPHLHYCSWGDGAAADGALENVVLLFLS